MQLFPRNSQHRAKTTDLKVELTQIDHGGSNGSIFSEICTYGVGQLVKNRPGPRGEQLSKNFPREPKKKRWGRVFWVFLGFCVLNTRAGWVWIDLDCCWVEKYVKVMPKARLEWPRSWHFVAVSSVSTTLNGCQNASIWRTVVVAPRVCGTNFQKFCVFYSRRNHRDLRSK